MYPSHVHLEFHLQPFKSTQLKYRLVYLLDTWKYSNYLSMKQTSFGASKGHKMSKLTKIALCFTPVTKYFKMTPFCQNSIFFFKFFGKTKSSHCQLVSLNYAHSITKQIKRQWHVSLLISSHIFYRKIRHSERSSQFEIITLLHIFYNKERHCPEKSTSYLTYDSIYYISNNLEIIGLLIYLLPIHFNLKKNNNTCCTKHKIMSILIYNYSLGRK